MNHETTTIEIPESYSGAKEQWARNAVFRYAVQVAANADGVSERDVLEGRHAREITIENPLLGVTD